MALTFNVVDLLAVIDGVTEGIAAAEAKYQADCAAARTRHRDLYLRDTLPRVRELRDYLTKCLKSDTPPSQATASRIMGNSYTSDGVKFFAGGGDSGVKRTTLGYQRPDQLAGLAALLRAHTEATVSAHQLKTLGIHPRDLEKLFRAAATAGVRN